MQNSSCRVVPVTWHTTTMEVLETTQPLDGKRPGTFENPGRKLQKAGKAFCRP